MYSNTIDILNNSIIEWFDIAFNGTKNVLFFSSYKKEEKHHIFQMGQWDKLIQWLARFIPIVHTDNRIVKERKKKNTQDSQSLPQK